MVTESEWSADERAWLIASRDYESSIGGHGHFLEESTSPLADPANKDGLWRYEAGSAPQVDYAAKAQHEAQDAYRKAWPDASMAGLFFPVRKVWVEPNK